MQVFRFDRASGQLSPITGDLGGTINTVHWSADGQYLIAGGDSLAGNDFRILRFDRSGSALDPIADILAGTIRTARWSPDGQNIAVGGTSLSGGHWR